ncbi:protein-tyrosine phosphatase [Faecalimonas umbilicata]|uniref:protein-tyrosine-phosphatase n=1 Tax=Faecalimonas umbilicata TaxID=1912855 RepID=A0A4R3JUM7_9FIRM|nr:CpsB/CapC family capsule biosynthesis tyrosine phosphatase [Faecalimonas umbilicata]TCS69667.1 protein-tyrosine phosphatase [Faecalimonas umbilicata]GBU05917.1 tyrosine protein phosphatase [Faecalimonas umbilicata]
MKGLIDIHAHILPGVDDGASDFQESVRMLKSAYRQGVRCVIATPHYHRNHFHRNPERTMEALQKIRGWLREHLPDMIVLLGTEIYYTIDFAEEIAAGNIFPMAKSRYLLVEFSPLEDYAYIRNAVHVMVNRGYCPIIAHAERYRVFHQNVSRISEVIQLGAYIQLNGDSIVGKNGLRMKLFAQKLMKKELVHFVASDMHHMESRRPNLKECAEYMEKTYGFARTKELLYDNPRKLIENKLIEEL